MKEANSDKPYFVLKVDNNDILEKIEETDEPKIFDSTTLFHTVFLEKRDLK